VAGNFTVPLGNRSARGEADRAGYAVYRTRSDLEELERSVVAQVEEQVRTLDSARRKVELADANLRLAEVTLKAEEALSDAGRSIQKDVLEARNEVTRTKAEATKARTDYRVALVVLRKLQGQLEENTP
jgi:outer membrane protein TolC